MLYVVGALTIQSSIEMPKSYDAFRTDNLPEKNIKNLLKINSSISAPDLSYAVKRATHEMMVVWETDNKWIYESRDGNSFMTITRDYTLAHFYSEAEDFTFSMQPLLQMLVECCLIYIGTAIIHASCVSINGEAVLFSAPSGIGKSTRAKSWIELFGASWISGDRPAIDPTLQIVHGVPWDGKDRVFTNSVAPIRMIAFIRRSDRTYAQKMTAKQMQEFLSTQLLIPMWDVVLVQRAFIAMKQIIDRVLICRLYCGITENSIRESYDILFRHSDRIVEAKEEPTMRMKKNFTIVEVAGDYIVVPVGENAATFGGTVVVNEVTAFILKAMNKPITKDEILEYMLNEYDIDRKTAAEDLDNILYTLKDVGLID